MTTLEQIVLINSECFTSDDPYSDLETLKYLVKLGDIKYFTLKRNNKVIGYLLYKVYETHLESIRRALTREERSKGLGLKLTKKLIRISHKLNKSIYTYVSKTNLASLNSNLKLGYKITDISDSWVYIRYYRKVNV